MISAAIATVVALSAWFALYLNDEIFSSRSLPWISPLVRVQDPGFHIASRLFPCQEEGFDTGCEAYKRFPAFLVANALAYLPICLIGVACCRNFKQAEAILLAVARQFIRWSLPASIAGLSTLLIMHSLGFKWWDFQYPTTNPWHWHSSLWNLVSVTTGTIILISGFLLPFYCYRAFRKNGSLREQRSLLSQLMSLTTVMLAALMLGYVY